MCLTLSTMVDKNPLMQSIFLAKQRGVQVRVILEEESDADKAAQFLKKADVPVRYIAGSYLHNKAVIVDGITASVSSINWSGTSLQQNRESGVVFFNATAIANYYTTAFDYDWTSGSQVSGTSPDPVPTSITKVVVPVPTTQFPLFNVSINVTTFVNPDLNAAYALVMNYFANAKLYIHVEMYSITLKAFADAIVASKATNKLKDVSVIISRTRVGYYDATLTAGNLVRRNQISHPFYILIVVLGSTNRGGRKRLQL